MVERGEEEKKEEGIKESIGDEQIDISKGRNRLGLRAVKIKEDGKIGRRKIKKKEVNRTIEFYFGRKRGRDDIEKNEDRGETISDRDRMEGRGDTDEGIRTKEKRRREDEGYGAEREQRLRLVTVGSGDRIEGQAGRERLRPTDPATAEGWGD